MSYDNSNKGVLFKNDKKETDKHPDYQGSININGTEHFLSAWINKSKAGNSYMSLSIGSVKENQGGGEKPQEEKKPDEFFDDSIPFKQPHDEYFG